MIGAPDDDDAGELDEKRRQEGQGAGLVAVHLGEVGDDIEEEERHHGDERQDQEHGIGQGGDELASDRQHPLLVRDESLQHVHEGAALFACPHGRRIEGREKGRMGRHGVRQGDAALDGLDDACQGRAVSRLFHPLVEDLEGLKDGESRLDERHEFLVEDEEVLLARAAAYEARLLLLDVEDKIPPHLQRLTDLGRGGRGELIGNGGPVLAHGLVSENRHTFL